MSIYLENLQVRLVEELRRVGPPVIAKQTGIARATVYNWMEKGNVPMDKLALLEVAGADVLYVPTGQRSPSMPAADPAEQVLLDSYRRCSAQARQNLIQTAVLLSAGLPSKPKAAPRGSAGGQHNVGDNAIQIGSVSGEARVKNR